MHSETNILQEIEQHVVEFFRENIPAEYVYHDLQHTRNVVEAVVILGKALNLSERELEILQIAAWFHDLGYDKGAMQHEERSCAYAREYLQKIDYPPEIVSAIMGCIMATKMPQEPENLLQEIICDADMAHLGKKNYWDRCGRVRQEILLTKSIVMSEQEWVDFELEFLQQHKYHTPAAQEMFDKRKNKHFKQLRKQKLRLNPKEVLSVAEVAKRDKKKKKKHKLIAQNGRLQAKDINQLSLGRGVETMYRTTYRTHVNLSSIADNKANIMLSINAIIISIIVSTLVPTLDEKPNLIYPTVIMLIVCLGAMVFAILSTRPKITEGKFNRQDIKEKKSNLLFFGNFYNMTLDDFQWGMEEMIKDNEFLYSSMTRDIYFLGIVLAKKYKYLRICYGIFMYGLILSVLAFAIAFLT